MDQVTRPPQSTDSCRRSDDRRKTDYRLNRHAVQGRRRQQRRLEDNHHIDLYDRHLGWLAMIVVVLCLLDALFTLHLLNHGAKEMNAFMDFLIRTDTTLFLTIKYGLTAFGIMTLLVLDKARLFRRLRGRHFIYLVALGYACLIGYELSIMPLNY